MDTTTINTHQFSVATYMKGDTDASKMAIVLPGFLDTKDYPHMRGHVDFLAQQGYLALSFDPPGTWESGGMVADYTMTNYLRAVDDLIAHFGNKPTLLVGHSMGGSVAMLSAISNPHVVCFAAIMSAASYIRADNYNDRVFKWQKEGVKVSYRGLPDDPSVKKEFALPYSFSEDAAQYDAREGLKTLHKPKLFIAGDKDDVVSASLVSELYELAAEPKQYVLLDSDHDYRRHPELINKVNDCLMAIA